MRFNAVVLLSSALVLGACSKGKEADDTTAAMKSDTAMAAPAGNTAAAATPTTAGTMAPITGKTWEVKMVGDAKGYRFEPANLTIKVGDGVKFEMESGGPHNVQFDAAAMPAESHGQLNANMSDHTGGDMTSKMLMNKDENVTVSFANVKPGVYNFHCVPHQAMGMKGAITVQ